MVNRITNILGVIAIVAAITSVFLLEKVNWWDALGGGVLGVSLIYTKNSDAANKIIDAIKSRQ